MKTFIRSSCVLIMLPFLYSCSEKEQNGSNETAAANDNYIIELDDDYKFHKITHTDDHGNTYVSNFEYSDDRVRIFSAEGSPGCIYYLNNAGLADSSCSGRYYYDQEGYLITDLTSGTGSRIHQYSGGNRIKTTWGSNKIYYTYYSNISLLDIHNFQGSFLGKPNRNLILSVRLEFLKASNGVTTNYSYQLNKEGLVVKRTAVSVPNDGSPSRKSVADFEYVFVSQ